MNEEVENRECLNCSHCTSDGYKRAGEDEITSFMTYWGIMPRKSATKALTRFTLLSHGIRLRNWTECEIEKALSILEEEKKIRTLGPFLIRGIKPTPYSTKKNT